jgi:hypothetical protein
MVKMKKQIAVTMNPTHHAPTQRGSAGVKSTLKLGYNYNTLNDGKISNKRKQF